MDSTTRTQLIIASLASGFSQAETANEFGVSREWVRQVANKNKVGMGKKLSHPTGTTVGGDLEVAKRLGPQSYMVKCEKHGQFTVSKQSMMRGCLRCRKEIISSRVIGRKFGSWTVLEKGRVEIYKNTRNYWLKCQCSCGAIKEIQRGCLTSGRSKKCRECHYKKLRQTIRERSA